MISLRKRKEMIKMKKRRKEEWWLDSIGISLNSSHKQALELL